MLFKCNTFEVILWILLTKMALLLVLLRSTLLFVKMSFC